MTALDRARGYLKKGWVTIPCQVREKAALAKNWPKRTIETATASLDQDFANPSLNIGVLMGEASGWLTDVDLDSDIAARLAPHFLPRTATFGRASRPASHWLFKCEGAITRKFITQDGAVNGTTEKATVVEIRSTGCQTMFPGSVHPSGERVEWTAACPAPTEITPAELERRVAQLNEATRLVRGGMPDDEAVEAARHFEPISNPRRSTDQVHPQRSNKMEGKSPPVESRRVRIAANKYNKDHPRTWPVSNGTCPFCSHNECFRQTKDDPSQWICFSASHSEGGTLRGSQYFGDALDFDAHAAGRTRKDHLKANDYLEDSDEVESLDDEPITDSGIAARFVEEHGDRLRYVAAVGTWFIYNGQRWQKDTSNQVLNLCRQTARRVTSSLRPGFSDPALRRAALRQEQSGRLNGAISIAATDPQISTSIEVFDSHPTLINCLNGTVDMTTGELRPHRREDYLTCVTTCDFNPSARAPRYEAFMMEIMCGDEELIEYVHRFVGYSLTGLVTEQVFALFFGKGSNGKSVLAATIVSILGHDYCVTLPPEMLTARRNGGHHSEAMQLLGKRIAIAHEVGLNAAFDEALVKRLSGGDEVNGRKNYGDWVAFDPTHQLFLLCNNLPEVLDTSPAFWRRIRVIPFLACFTENANKGLLAELDHEHEGILAIWVAAAVRFMSSGLGASRAVDEATAAYRHDEDIVAMFCREHLRAAGNKEVTAEVLMTAFHAWISKQGRRWTPWKVAKARLKDLGWTERRKNGGILLRPPPSNVATEGRVGSVGSVPTSSIFTLYRKDKEDPTLPTRSSESGVPEPSRDDETDQVDPIYRDPEPSPDEDQAYNDDHRDYGDPI